VTLAERLNFARAAEDLSLSQSALSRSIQTLEKDLGMRLFDRDRAGVALTPQGKIAVDRAKLLLADAEDMERYLLMSARSEAGRVSFGMVPMVANALMAGVISERLSIAPEVTNEVMVRDSQALWSLLIAGDIEFFVGNEGATPDFTGARVETLGLFPLSTVVRPDHPLILEPPSNAKFPVIRSSWSGLPLPAGVEARMCGRPNIIEDFSALAAITRRTDALWFSSRYSILDELWSGRLREAPITGPSGSVRVAIYSLSRRTPSPWAKAMKQLLSQRTNELAKLAHEIERRPNA
jgi:DNA-binding transcriptional LysR family regulator